MCITETHLTSSISSSFVKIPHFNLFRNDVQGKVHKHGVCAFVHEDILVDCVSYSMRNALLFRLAVQNVYILIVYRPPSYTAAENDTLVQVLESVISGKEIIIVGDFNLPNIEWLSIEELPSARVPPLDSMFLDVFNANGLIQWVVEPTFPSSGNILDLLLTSEKDRIGNVTIHHPLPSCDHCPVLFCYVFQSDLVECQPQTSQDYSWHRGNYDRLNELLAMVDWDFELSLLNACKSFDKFASIVRDLIQECIPQRVAHSNHKPPWRTNPPRGMIRERHEAWLCYKRARVQIGRKSATAQEAFSRFASANKSLRNFEVRSQANYENSLIDRFRENPKLLHSYIRSKKSVPSSIGPLKLPSGDLCSDPLAMSKCLASSFASVFCREVQNNQEPHQLYDGHIDPIHISVDDVKAQLITLDINAAMGPDRIHPMVLKSCAHNLVYPLHMIFSQSLQEGIVPMSWKRSTVVPIFKKGHRFEPLNYRPVSLTPVCCKSMERIISDHLQDYLNDNTLLSHHQFGFRRGRSTMEQLLLVYENISASMDSGNTVDLVLFDYSKAFDVVCHQILIAKLQSIGIDGQLLKWIASFLTGREMQVSVKGHLSGGRAVNSGVPQGSVLGPLLFLIYINHVGSNLASNYKIFADDLKLYSHVNSNPPCQYPAAATSIQNDIDVLHRTSKSWGLKMNREKCAVLRFSRNFKDQVSPLYCLDGSPLPVCQSHNDLGVLVDVKLKFHEHIVSVAHKASGLCQSFLKSTVCRTPNFMMFLFRTHVRPLIEYASCVWNTGYREDLQKLERVQRSWTKKIDNLRDLSYAERLRELELYSVQGRLLRADLIQIWKIFNGISCTEPENFFTQPPRGGTRGHRFKIHVSHVTLDVRKRSFSNRCVHIWNNLPECVVTAPDLGNFKKGLANEIKEDLYRYVC